MQTQPLTWQAIVLQLLQTLGPALFVLVGTLITTYLTLRHQRKLKRDEMASSTSLKARELMFSLYEKRLTILIEQSQAMARSAATLLMAYNAESLIEREKKFTLLAEFMSSIAVTGQQFTEYVEDLRQELLGLGLAEKYANEAARVNQFIQDPLKGLSNLNDSINAQKVVALGMEAMTGMIKMQRAVVEAKARQLFQEYLPSPGTTPVKR